MLSTLESLPGAMNAADRGRALRHFLEAAIRSGLDFDAGEGRLLRNGLTGAGDGRADFNPFSEHFYHLACECHSPFASVIERATGLVPFKAMTAFDERGITRWETRMFPGLAVAIMGRDDYDCSARRNDDNESTGIGGGAVWRCVSIDYSQGRIHFAHLGERLHAGVAGRKIYLTRDRWNAIQRRLSSVAGPS